MKQLGFLLIGYVSTIQFSFAAENDLGILGNGDGCLTQTKLRNGDIHINNIPCLLKGAIDFFMGIAGTIAIIFVIIGAYKILFGSLEQDKTKGKDTIIMALTGFAIASLSWFIIKIILDNFS
ncbi:hypothetical protein A9Q91_05715 [Candidatus Gracilibacteria bacterium 28_42_T64]|nr:hypothetical protein A9Q91_05715 [Candidatus Gracilibacteria bacterium 28_42_T64]